MVVKDDNGTTEVKIKYGDSTEQYIKGKLFGGIYCTYIDCYCAKCIQYLIGRLELY